MKANFFVIVLLMSFTTVLVGQTPERGSKKPINVEKKMIIREGQRNPMMALNLTDAQKEQLKRSAIEMQKQILPLRNQIGEAEAHMKTLVTAEKNDLSAIYKNIEKIGSIRVEMAKIQAKQRMEMRAQLTDEQRMKFDLQMMQQDLRMMHKDRGMMNRDRGMMNRDREMMDWERGIKGEKSLKPKQSKKEVN